MVIRSPLLWCALVILLLSTPSSSGARNSKKRKRRGSSQELSSHTEATVTLAVGSHGEQSELQLKLPNRAAAKIETPGQLMTHVSHAWDVVVDRKSVV